MAVGGARPGAGRKKGSQNRLSKKNLEIAEKAGPTPLEFLLRVMNNDVEDMDRRLDAAKAAAPYCHSKLTSVQVSGGLSISHEDALKELE